MKHVYITVAGNIGAGKSTLVAILAEAFGWQPYYELVADHPYLDDYYQDRGRWGFHSQIWFLSQRFEQQQEITDTPTAVNQDRSIYEDYEVFVKGLLEQGILSHRITLLLSPAGPALDELLAEHRTTIQNETLATAVKVGTLPGWVYSTEAEIGPVKLTVGVQKN